MKKLLLMSVITLMLGATSAYAKCEGGEEFQGAINGHTYCISSTSMTWWAAFAWCEFQGRELVSMDQLCPNWGGASGRDICPNMKLDSDKYGWSSDPDSSSNAFIVHLRVGDIFDKGMYLAGTYRNYGNQNYAICY